MSRGRAGAPLRGAVGGEFLKAASLPATWATLGLTFLGTLGVVLMSARREARLDPGAGASPADLAFDAAPLGVVGAVVLGVLAVSGEYRTNSPGAGGGRQLTTTLVAVPRRSAVLAAKAVVLVALVAAGAAVTLAASLTLARPALGDAAGAHEPGALVGRAVGVALYWALMALLALAVTVLARGPVLPLVWFLVNGSVVSFSALLAKVTPVARLLPDLAGLRLFADASSIAVDDPLAPLPGGLVMAAWAAALLGVAAFVLHRRDA
ncbi:ABC transporter permease [Streptomyces triticirhizae]|uniref:ABC transporter permease n=1 Tax=Streptomyces triticirhizae TaxID=2483353 RepID=A0A3M2M897_9ACTN|nr:ABC transporter permease [Streptomyces triticirhizae]RMI45200.1 ABC transporter permease [Streptomyces triticirhizae]